MNAGLPRFWLDAPQLPPDLAVEAWAADDALGRPGEMELLCLSADPGLDPAAMLGRPLALVGSGTHGVPWRRCGHVVQARAEDGDGGLFRYRLQVGGWLALLAHGLHSRLWLQRSLEEILSDVFRPYADLARWRMATPADVDDRPDVVVQYRERDLDFVLRLLAAHGRVLRTDPASDTVWVLADTTDEAQCAQDESSARLGALPRRRPGPVSGDEAVTALSRTTRLPPRGLVTAAVDPSAARVLGAALATGGALPPSRWMAGESEFRDADAAQRQLGRVLDAARAQQRRWQGRSAVRSLAPGRWLRLDGDDTLPPLLVTRVRQAGVNDRLRDGPQRWPLEAPWLDGPLREAAWAGGYANAFDAVDRAQPWRPALAPSPQVPGLLHGEVVGRDGDPPGALAADAAGRLRVRLDFQAPGVGGDGAWTGAATGWLRVVQPWGGAGVAAQWLPRVGQRVVVGFLDGDARQAVVLAGVHDGIGEGGLPPTPGGRAAALQPAPPAGEDHRPAGQGNLVAGAHAPPWHGGSPAALEAGGQANAAAMTGWCSRELGGDGGNQLVFDDSDGALRVQLASSHAGTQLNLGALVHQAGNRRGSERGRGFELRTDGAGALRAAQGLLLSACLAPPCAPAADNAAGHASGQALLRLANTLARAATLHRAATPGAVEPAGGNQLRAACDGLHASADAPATIAAHAPGGLLITAASQVEAAGGTLTQAAGRDLALACGAGGTVHAGARIAVVAAATAGGGTEGLEVSAAGRFELRAEQGDAALEARDAVSLQSASAGVQLQAARRLMLAVDGGAGIVLDGSGLRLVCPGTLTVEASERRFVGPR